MLTRIAPELDRFDGVFGLGRVRRAGALAGRHRLDRPGRSCWPWRSRR